MKSDQNGCSTCAAGQESYETTTIPVGGKRRRYYQYDYRHTNGELFSTVADSLETCRKRRDKWLSTQ